MTLKQISAYDLRDNVFNRIGKQWMLIAAAKPDGSVNAMTAAWGGMGFIWQKPVAFAFIRPQRCTKTFVEASSFFSLSFLGDEHRDALNYLGNISGFDDSNKIENSGLDLCFWDSIPYFSDSELVMICQRLYQQDMQENSFLDPDIISRFYKRNPKQNDFHTLYIAGIEQVLYRPEQ